jgi:hypothetical protein
MMARKMGAGGGSKASKMDRGSRSGPSGKDGSSYQGASRAAFDNAGRNSGGGDRSARGPAGSLDRNKSNVVGRGVSAGMVGRNAEGFTNRTVTPNNIGSVAPASRAPRPSMQNPDNE